MCKSQSRAAARAALSPQYRCRTGQSIGAVASKQISAFRNGANYNCRGRRKHGCTATTQHTNPHFAMLKKPLPDHPKVIRADEIYQEVANYVKVYVNRGAYDCVCGLYWLQSSLCRHWFKGQPVHCGVADRAGVLTSATRKTSLISRFVQFCSITLANVVDERWDAI
jgi:hypothetical protein